MVKAGETVLPAFHPKEISAMPTVSNPTLTLTTVNSRVTIRATCSITFTPFERFLAAGGMEFHTHHTIHGMDPGGASLVGAEIVDARFPTFHLGVTAGTTDQVIFSDHSLEVDRAVLQEDTNGDDEIRCKIRVHAVGLPPEFTEDVFSPERVLLG
jgi:hypothetical protein